MAVKKFFDGNSLTEIELPDQPIPNYGHVVGENSLITADNPMGVDPTLLKVDAAQVNNLRPTQGASPTPKFPDPLPGNGEGAGVGQKSGSVLRDAWANNQNRDTEIVESVQSGPVGSLVPQATDAARPISPQAPEPVRTPDDNWTKDELIAYIQGQPDGVVPDTGTGANGTVLKADLLTVANELQAKAESAAAEAAENLV